MKEKIQNQAKYIRDIFYGGGLLFVSLCAVAFGGAYLGASIANRNNEVSVTLCPVDELYEQDCD